MHVHISQFLSWLVTWAVNPCWLCVSVSMSVSVSAVDRSSITLAISLLLSCHLVSVTENHFFSNYIHSSVKWNVILFGGIGLSENSRVVTVLQLITVKINRIFDNIPDANLPLKYVMSAVWGKSPNSNPLSWHVVVWPQPAVSQRFGFQSVEADVNVCLWYLTLKQC